MAKKRRVKTKDRRAKASAVESLSERDPAVRRSGESGVARALTIVVLSALPVYLMYHPSDSTLVESGDALWFAAIALGLATLTWVLVLWNRTSRESVRPCDRIVDVTPWALGVWMMVAAFATCPPGNLRMATNEAWVWVGAACVFTSARRWLADRVLARGMICLIGACGIAIATHTLHQTWISLPQSQAEYLTDPDGMLAQLGLHAPEGSAARMLFENRLFDGGPNATFALANSMAAPVLVATVLIMGWIRFRWSVLSRPQRLCLIAMSAIGFSGLFAARSRSALLALIVAMVAIWWLGRQRTSESVAEDGHATGRGNFGFGKPLVFSLVVVMLVGAVSLALALFGRREWAEQAPASLAFRLQYWRATLRMTWEQPWTGFGPGNFKTIYPRFRDEGAGELIAEPHNFVFETMAAGGLVAVGLLIVLGGTIIWIACFRSNSSCRRDTDDCGETKVGDSNAATVFWGGATGTLALIWLTSLLVGQPPDWEAHVFAVPIAGLAGWVFWHAMAGDRIVPIRRLAAIGLVSLLIHLCASGGWTVPGVAILVWLLAAIICPMPLTATTSLTSEHATHDFARRWPAVVVAVAGLGGLLLLRLMSLGPMLAVDSALGQFEHGTMAKREPAIARALEADPWSAEAATTNAFWWHWRLMESDTPANREAWAKAVEIVRDRANEDWSAYNSLGRHSLHLYQRYGKQFDLVSAEQFFARALEYSPHDHSIMSQLAAVYSERGDEKRAQKLAQRAYRVSVMGGDVVRFLERQFIVVAEPKIVSAHQSAVFRPASQVLANQLSPDSVN